MVGLKNAENYLLRVKEKFGKYYERIGVNLDDFL